MYLYNQVIIFLILEVSHPFDGFCMIKKKQKNKSIYHRAHHLQILYAGHVCTMKSFCSVPKIVQVSVILFRNVPCR